jgi:ribosomal protein L31
MTNLPPNRAHYPSRKALPTPEENREHIESMFSNVEVEPVRDPFTGVTHIDLSDPEHPFWTGKYK